MPKTKAETTKIGSLVYKASIGQYHCLGQYCKVSPASRGKLVDEVDGLGVPSVLFRLLTFSPGMKGLDRSWYT